MNKRLSEAVEHIKGLSEERQQQAASLLLDFIEEQDGLGVELTAEQRSEIEESLAEDEELATDEEVKAFFARLLG